MAEDVVYDSARRVHPALEGLRQLMSHRELILQLVRRDVLTRYKRSVLGIAWTLLDSLGYDAGVDGGILTNPGFNTLYGYAAFVLSGLIRLELLRSFQSAPPPCQPGFGSQLTAHLRPRSSFALAAIGTAMVKSCWRAIRLLVVNVITGVPFTPAFLFVPVPLLLLACFSLGLGLLLSTSAVYFRDVAEMYQIVLSASFYLTPISTPLRPCLSSCSSRSGSTRCTKLLNLFRLSVYYGRFPTSGPAMALFSHFPPRS